MHNQANKLLMIHHQMPPSRLDQGQPTHCGSFVKSMYLHMSHISSFSNNYASKLKLKYITLYSRSHKQELLTTTFEKGIPHACEMWMYNWHIHVHVHTQVSCRLCVQCTYTCMQCARGSWLFRTQYHVPFPRIVIGQICIWGCYCNDKIAHNDSFT